MRIRIRFLFFFLRIRPVFKSNADPDPTLLPVPTMLKQRKTSVGPGVCALLTPGCWIRDPGLGFGMGKNVGPGSEIRDSLIYISDYISESLVTMF
jgi:hypothetical protein